MNINHIFQFEELRDGGSLNVSFQSDDSCEYWICFQVANFGAEVREFKEPVLVNRTTNLEVDLSRVAAKQWLKKLEPYFVERDELSHFSKKREAEILSKMFELYDEKSGPE